MYRPAESTSNTPTPSVSRGDQSRPSVDDADEPSSIAQTESARSGSSGQSHSPNQDGGQAPADPHELSSIAHDEHSKTPQLEPSQKNSQTASHAQNAAKISPAFSYEAAFSKSAK